MEELYNYGLDNNDIKNMIEINNEIVNLDSEEIIKNIKILQNIKCEEQQIKNILVSNPFYLNRCSSDVLNMINKLLELGLSTLNLLFDSNPWLLNKDRFEIEDFVNKKLNEGMLLDNIIDMIDSNPYVIDEINL